MDRLQAWKILGIEKTSDKRAIKRAYAARLKAIDPDRDPEDFLKLRQALEIAQWEVDSDLWEQENPESNDEDDFEASETQTAQDPVVGLNIDPVAARRQRLGEILWGEEPIAPLEDEARSLAAQIIADGEAGTIDEAGNVEDWLLWLTANTIRRSDCIIPYLEDHYEWRSKQGSIHSGHAHDAIINRYDDLAFLETIKRPGHVFHTNYALLTTPRTEPPGRAERARHRPNLNYFVSWIRQNHPTVEWDFIPETMAMWDGLGKAETTAAQSDESGNKFRLILLAFIVIGALLRMCSSLDTAPPVGPVPENEGVTALYDMWRAEQDPAVQTRMDVHRNELLPLFWDGKTLKIPACSRLGAIVVFTPAEERKCVEAQNLRLDSMPPATFAPPAPPSDIAQSSDQQTQWIYSSPLWRGEQAPRVQRWMDEHPDQLNQLLQPYVKKGGLPDCSKLAAAANLTRSELEQCQAAQARRLTRRVERPPALPAPAYSPPATVVPDENFDMPKPKPSREKPTGTIDGDLCSDPAFKDACKAK